MTDLSTVDDGNATRISAVILKIAAPCNLNCSYCYLYNHEDQSWRGRPKVISDETYDQVLHRLRDYAARKESTMSITFHGGEPMLVGAQRFDALATRAREVMGERLSDMQMQTNGTLVDDEWCEVLARQGINPGVSMDGPAEFHDAVRVDHQGRGSHARVMAGLTRLRDAGFEPYILCVIDPAASGLEIYRHFRSQGVRKLDFLLPDVSHDNKAARYGAFGETPVADYLLPIHDAWFAEDDPKIEIRVFWDLYRGLLGAQSMTDSFGNPPMKYLIIDTDGSMEPLDALRVCEDGATRSTLNVAENDIEELWRGSETMKLAYQGMPLCDTCRSCPEVEVCGGGYLPHRYSKARGFDNPSVWCRDLLRMIAHMRGRLDAVTIP